MSLSLDEVLKARLRERNAKSQYRKRSVVASSPGAAVEINGRRLRLFCSNDYLGLASHPRVAGAVSRAAKTWGSGSGAAHLVCGHSSVHHALEEALAEFTGRPRALLFSTGYMANLGAINALIGQGDAVFEDKLNHASLLDGGLLSQAQFKRFRHADTAHLARQLASSQARHKLIVTDGVFSMDGDLAPLTELAELARQHNAWLMVDDAHGIGCLGEQGGGLVQQLQLGVDQVPVLMGTLGKAVGSFGAFVAGSEALIESLVQFARPYIYTTALPAAVAAATLAALQVIAEEPWRRQHLQQLIQHFRTQAAALRLPLMPSPTAIQPILIGDDAQAMAAADFLLERGFWISAIRPPTVPAGTARLRVTLSAAHSFDDVDALMQALSECPGLSRG